MNMQQQQPQQQQPANPDIAKKQQEVADYERMQKGIEFQKAQTQKELAQAQQDALEKKMADLSTAGSVNNTPNAVKNDKKKKDKKKKMVSKKKKVREGIYDSYLKNIEKALSFSDQTERLYEEGDKSREHPGFAEKGKQYVAADQDDYSGLKNQNVLNAMGVEINKEEDLERAEDSITELVQLLPKIRDIIKALKNRSKQKEFSETTGQIDLQRKERDYKQKALDNKIRDKVTEGKAPKENDLIPGGLGDNRPDSDFDSEQLKMGIKVEMEHTNDKKKAKEIAKDHLSEDPDYYTKLKKMEPGHFKEMRESLGEEGYAKWLKENKNLKKGYKVNLVERNGQFGLRIFHNDKYIFGERGWPHNTREAAMERAKTIIESHKQR